jgi:hypothetical protein
VAKTRSESVGGCLQAADPTEPDSELDDDSVPNLEIVLASEEGREDIFFCAPPINDSKAASSLIADNLMADTFVTDTTLADNAIANSGLSHSASTEGPAEPPVSSASSLSLPLTCTAPGGFNDSKLIAEEKSETYQTEDCDRVALPDSPLSPAALPTEAYAALPTEASAAMQTEASATLPTEAQAALPTEVSAAPPTEALLALPTVASVALPTEVSATLPTEVSATLPTEVSAALPTQASATLPTEAPEALPTATPAALPTAAPAALLARLSLGEEHGEELASSLYLEDAGEGFIEDSYCGYSLKPGTGQLPSLSMASFGPESTVGLVSGKNSVFCKVGRNVSSLSL